MIDELGVYFQPEVVAARLARAKGSLVWRLAAPGVLAVFFGIMWAAQPEVVGGYAPWFLVSLLASVVVSAAIGVIMLTNIRYDARHAPGGLALGVNREGALMGATWFDWDDVATMSVEPGGLGRSNRLVLTARDDRLQWFPLAYTDAIPGWLDSAVRALSGGRVGLDLSRLDE